MARLVAILATTHHPFSYRTARLPPEERPDFADAWIRKVETYRETLTRARPDVLVMVGSDHFHQLWLDTMPQFLVTLPLEALRSVPGRFVLAYGNLLGAPWEWTAAPEFGDFVDRHCASPSRRGGRLS